MHGILGMDFLEKHNGQILIKEAVLGIKENRISLQHCQTKNCAFIKCSAHTVIPAYSEALFEVYISGKINPDASVMVEPLASHGNKGYLISRALVDQNSNKIRISAINYLSRDVTIHKHKIVASVQEAHFVDQTSVINSEVTKTGTHVHLHIQTLTIIY